MESVVYKSRKKDIRCGIARNVKIVRETSKTIKYKRCYGVGEITVKKEDVIFFGDHEKAEKIYKEF